MAKPKTIVQFFGLNKCFSLLFVQCCLNAQCQPLTVCNCSANCETCKLSEFKQSREIIWFTALLQQCLNCVYHNQELSVTQHAVATVQWVQECYHSQAVALTETQISHTSDLGLWPISSGAVAAQRLHYHVIWYYSNNEAWNGERVNFKAYF